MKTKANIGKIGLERDAGLLLSKEIEHIYRRASNHLRNGSIQKAINRFEEAIEKAENLDERFIKVKYRCLLLAGICYAKLGRYEEGLKHLHEAIPDEKNGEDELTFEVYYNIGLGNLSLELFSKAINYFDLALCGYRDINVLDMQAIVLSKLGYCWVKMDNADQAVTCYENAQEIFLKNNNQTNETLIMTEMASVFCNLKRCKKCLKILSEIRSRCQAITDESILCQVYHNIGLTYNDMAMYNDATDCFELALQNLTSKNKEDEFLSAHIYQGLGAVLNQLCKFKEAVDYHIKAINLFEKLKDKSSESKALCNIAYAYCMLDNTDKSSQYYNKACQAANDADDKLSEMEAHEGLGDIAYKQDQYSLAIRHYKLAIKMLSLCRAWSNDTFERLTMKLSDSIESQVERKLYKNKLASMKSTMQQIEVPKLLDHKDVSDESSLDHTYQTIHQSQMLKSYASDLDKSHAEGKHISYNKDKFSLTASYVQPREIHHHLAKVEQMNLAIKTQYQNLKPYRPKAEEGDKEKIKDCNLKAVYKTENRQKIANSSKNTATSRGCTIL